jgi:DNA polymerase (family X)
VTENQHIAGILEEVSRILAHQGANRFRVQAYVHAAESVSTLNEPVSEIFRREGLAGLDAIPGVGTTISHVMRDILLHGRSALLQRLRGESDPVALLASVPGVGKVTANQLHDELGIESLQDLELAAHDGRLAKLAGIGAKRLAGIRDTLAQRLGRVQGTAPVVDHEDKPSVAELLDVDHEYREAAQDGRLEKIAPKRFNPHGEAWLPILHVNRGPRHYTALFSNTAHAHELGKTSDWVVLYYDGSHGEYQSTVITSTFGRLKGKRIVRGRESECEAFYSGQ